MGGRGAASGARQSRRERLVPVPLSYEVITPERRRGGASYPFLEGMGRAWSLVRYGIQEEVPQIRDEHAFGMGEPTLRWVSDSGVTDLYVDGMSTGDYLQQSGLELDLHKGGYVLSKRLSRALRSYRACGFFPAETVRIGYMEQEAREAKVWDGAGLVSRGMLRRMVLADDLSPAQRRKLERELAHARRVEFTVQTERGQDKGHAIVAERLLDDDGNEVDFLLPQDTKREVRLTGGEAFVGINPVHGHERMRLDIQSLIHLRPFLREAELLGRLREEGELFVEAIRSGRAGEAMARIDRHETVEDVQRWHLREFLACGGQPMWFGAHVRTLLNQHLQRLNHQALDKMRLPVPGGRLYVLPAGVGQRAGLQLEVPRGHVKLDPTRETAWVNDEDWLALEYSPKGEGIAGILGGADNDDALWLLPFTDHDGARRVLAWRSPNQLGEYVVLQPTADSPALTWATPEGEVSDPDADSRHLPVRIDRRETRYLGLVDPESAGGLGKGEAYSVGAMDAAIGRARANAGALGMYCNALMLHKTLFDDLPEEPPAPLEDFIDASVKTGADLSQGKQWCVEHSEGLLERGEHIPRRMRRRLSLDRDREPWALVPPVLGTEGDHWMDHLDGGVAAHIRWVEGERERLAAEATLPAKLWDAVFDDLGALEVGARFNQRYAATVREFQRQRRKQWQEGLDERVAAETTAYLEPFTHEERRAILRRMLWEERWRALARHRPTGQMTPQDHERALAEADRELARYRPEEQEAILRERVAGWKRRQLEQETTALTEADHEALRERMEGWLGRWPEARHTVILRGAMVSVHMSDKPGAEAGGVWLPGRECEDGTRVPGIAGKTLEALREIGLLDDLDKVETEDASGVIAYPRAQVEEPTYRTVGIRAAWFHWYRAYLAATGGAVPEALSKVPKAQERWAKDQLQQVARETLRGVTIHVREEEGRLIAYTEQGTCLGTVSRDSEALLRDGDQFTVQGAIARDGHVRVAITDQAPRGAVATD